MSRIYAVKITGHTQKRRKRNVENAESVRDSLIGNVGKNGLRSRQFYVYTFMFIQIYI